MKEIIRKPAVAGSFYPDNPQELDKILTGLINQSKKIPLKGGFKILIVPHAGIVFSGPTAAAGFKQIEGKNYSKIILLGASHQAWFDYAAVFDKGEWETPLGKIEVDEDLASAIIDKDAKIIAYTAVHNKEHSLEIELIFLQKVLKNFKIVPILLSQTGNELIEKLAQKIAQNLDDQTLLVVSSDLSHYPPYEIANKVDSQTIQAILDGQVKKFEKTIAGLESAGWPNLQTAACGQAALKVALKIGELGKLKFIKIKYQNSGDPPVGGQVPAGDKSQVVGYASIIGVSSS